MNMHKTFATALLGTALLASPAFAQEATKKEDPAAAAATEEESTGPITIEFTLTGVSDYRFRGLSLSDFDPAFQPAVTISHEAGPFISVWASNIAENPGADIEIDFTAGLAREIGGFDLSAIAVYYYYPGFNEINYVEIIGSAAHAVGPATVGVGFAYIPRQDNVGGVDNFYGYVNGSVPIAKTPLTLNSSVGVEAGAFGGNKKIDWSIGLGLSYWGLDFGLSYVDTARTQGSPLGRAGAVFSIGKTF